MFETVCASAAFGVVRFLVRYTHCERDWGWPLDTLSYTLMSSQLLNLLDNVKEQAKDALWALSSCLCKQSASVKINGRSCLHTFTLIALYRIELKLR